MNKVLYCNVKSVPVSVGGVTEGMQSGMLNVHLLRSKSGGGGGWTVLVVPMI